MYTPAHYNMRKISLYLVCSLLFSGETWPKCRENYGDSFSVIYGIFYFILFLFYMFAIINQLILYIIILP